MATQFVQLEIGLIEEGDLVVKANSELIEMQKKLIRFVRKHGEKARGGKAKLNIEITLACADPNDEHFTIKSQVKTALPSPPAITTMAMAAEGQDEQPCLFVRKTGSKKDTPRQGVIVGDNGPVS